MEIAIRMKTHWSLAMSRLKLIDRVALSALLLSAAAAIPLAAGAFSLSRPDGPSATIKLSSGVERQFFTTGPLGTTTDRVDIDASGRVIARTQVLTDDVFRYIRPGMPARDVLELIGPPSGKTRFPQTHTTAWEYHYRDGWGYTSEFSVMVDDRGVVASKFSGREGD